MILEKAIVPDIKDGCPTKEDWEARRKFILNTLSEIEYGKRPAVDYAVTWKELLREEMERLAKQRKREKSYREKRKAKKIAEKGLPAFLMPKSLNRKSFVVHFDHTHDLMTS